MHMHNNNYLHNSLNGRIFEPHNLEGKIMLNWSPYGVVSKDRLLFKSLATEPRSMKRIELESYIYLIVF